MDEQSIGSLPGNQFSVSTLPFQGMKIGRAIKQIKSAFSVRRNWQLHLIWWWPAQESFSLGGSSRSSFEEKFFGYQVRIKKALFSPTHLTGQKINTVATRNGVIIKFTIFDISDLGILLFKTNVRLLL